MVASLAVPNLYSAVAGNTSLFACADCILAQNPAKMGAARLVPPYCASLPLTMGCAPLLGSATKAMSGTPRLVDVPSTLAEICHAGAASVRLTPPPVPPLLLQVVELLQAHTVSADHTPAAVV